MKQCPQCERFSLKNWGELTPPEQLVAVSRPSPDDQALDHRRSYHLWCTQCWTEVHVDSGLA